MLRLNLMLVFCLLGMQASRAQTQLAPIGTEWYHNMSFGVFKSTVIGDTIINGLSSRHIEVEAVIKNPSQSPPVHGYDYYLYDHQDTVFIYNTLFNRFTPLYVFNVQPGDTLFLPVIPVEMEGRALPTLGSDSTFALLIDSVMMKNWDGVSLKTIYSHALYRDSANQFFPYFSFASEDSVGVYVQKLGSINTGFTPYCFNCSSLLDERNQLVGALRCYHEPGGPFIKLVDTCDNGATEITDREMVWPTDLKILPNPGKNTISLLFSGQYPSKLTVQVFDLMGRERCYKPGLYSNNQMASLDISGLSSGVYLIRVTGDNQSVINKKFVKK